MCTYDFAHASRSRSSSACATPRVVLATSIHHRSCYLEDVAAAAMALEIKEPMDGYRWVLAALLANIFLMQWMGLQVGKARRKYRVVYPLMYADESENKDAKTFNCVQRGHQNCIEFMPQFLVLLLLGGLQYPRVAAFLGLAYTVCRLQYFRGYSTGSAAARYHAGGGFHWFAFLGLLICTIALALHQFFPALV